MTAHSPLNEGDPRQIGEYAILQRLGVGGMGIVYLAESASGRLVALKVVHAALAYDDEFRRRFRSEVASARKVPPFCTAEILDADPEAAQPYLVAEYVDGPTLTDEVTNKGPLSTSSLQTVAVGIATALTVIHEAGVIHRDLKPSNVLLAPGGLKVIDFGIARALQSSTQYTRTDQIVGTINYMAPERFDEPGRPLTAAADVFAWGCVIAFAGTGQGPFDGDSPAATMGRILGKPPALDGFPEGALKRLVELALVLDPVARPTARELLTALLSSGAEAVAPPVPVTPVAPAGPDSPAVPAVSVSPAVPAGSGSPVSSAPAAAPVSPSLSDAPTDPVPSGSSSGPVTPGLVVPASGSYRGWVVPALASAVVVLVLALLGGTGFVVYRTTAKDSPTTAAPSIVATTAAVSPEPSVSPSAQPSVSVSASAHKSAPHATKSKKPSPAASTKAAAPSDQPPIKAADVTGESAFGPYFIYNLATTECVDIDGNAAGSIGQAVLQDVCQRVTKDNQEYEFVPHTVDADGNQLYWVRNTADSLCLDVPGSGVVDYATHVIEGLCLDNDNVDYRLKKQLVSQGRQFYRLINAVSGMCLDVDGVGNAGPATPLTLVACADNDDHEWGLVKRSDW